MIRLLIIGAGGHGAVVAEAAAFSDRWSEIVFLEDKTSESQVLGFPIVGSTSEIDEVLDNQTEAIVAIGDNRRRLELLSTINEGGGAIATVVHPKACVSPSATISIGAALLAGSIVNARTTVGVGCIANTGATIDHDCKIGGGVHISPGANLAGDVSVGECSWVGIGASVKEGVRIGYDVIVGAGAAVVSNVEDGVTVGGVPARVL